MKKANNTARPLLLLSFWLQTCIMIGADEHRKIISSGMAKQKLNMKRMSSGTAQKP